MHASTNDLIFLLGSIAGGVGLIVIVWSLFSILNSIRGILAHKLRIAKHMKAVRHIEELQRRHAAITTAYEDHAAEMEKRRHEG